MNIGAYAKAVAAFLGAIGAWGMTAVEDGVITQPEWFGLAIAIGGVFAVWAVPNHPELPELPDRPYVPPVD